MLGILLEYIVVIGQFITEGTTIAWAWFDSDEEREVFSSLYAKKEISPVQAITLLANDGFKMDMVRHSERDLMLPIRQLTDVATRALSPGVNDPQTAIQAMDALSLLFVHICKVRLQPNNFSNVERAVKGKNRMFAPGLRFSSMLGMCNNSIRAYGVSDYLVVMRAIHFLGDIATLCTKTGEVERVEACLLQIDEWAKVSKEHFTALSLEYKHIEAAIAYEENNRLNIRDKFSAEAIGDVEMLERPEDGIEAETVEELNVALADEKLKEAQEVKKEAEALHTAAIIVAKMEERGNEETREAQKFFITSPTAVEGGAF